ncbi:MAG: hypothetical protein HY822_03035 [Acidobacteria bacterium]|nr:hypothetical protein [Acidobacteriota bacterium]
MMPLNRFAFLLWIPCAGLAVGQTLNCDLTGYKPRPGLQAVAGKDVLRIDWQGEGGQELRAAFGLESGQPLIRELAARKAGGAWTVLGRDLRPEFRVTSGLRRVSEQQLQPLRKLKIDLTPEVLEQEKWNAFWDAPLSVPGRAGTNPGLPRRPEEIRRATAAYNAAGCQVHSDGARLEVTFPGLSMGIFAGRLMYTVYRGTNLLRQEAIAKTDEPSVAYKYEGGLKGFGTDGGAKVIWRDTARAWQEYRFGGPPNRDPFALRARNRVAVVERGGGSLAFFPPPHKFFFAREIELNLGYVYYRKDDEGSFAVGVRQPDREEMFRPYGFSKELWERRVAQSRQFAEGNFALYNAPPGTWQRMPVYFYLSAEDGRAAQAAVLRFTHEDRFKPLLGYQVAVSHFHTHFNEQLTDAGTLDFQPPWAPVFRALGVNIAMLSDFHSDSHPRDPGPLRLPEQNTYFEGCRRNSDHGFLVMPGEEPNAYFGGHYTAIFPRPVYWIMSRRPEQPLVEDHPRYGKVYHVGSAQDELDMFRREGGLVWQAHPRTKGSDGYPDAVRETAHFRSEQFLGMSFQSLPVDQSERRLCEKRCFGALDDMNNWSSPKYMVAEGDTYTKYPEDESYSQLLVNYIQLDRVPGFTEDWSPILRALRAGNFFVTSGEVLIRNFSVSGAGTGRGVAADIEWTFPLDFVEIVWGDGETTARRIVSATERPPFGSARFRIPLEAAGAKWVRLAAWDSAGNGAFTQPVRLDQVESGSAASPRKR